MKEVQQVRLTSQPSRLELVKGGGREVGGGGREGRGRIITNLYFNHCVTNVYFFPILSGSIRKETKRTRRNKRNQSKKKEE